MDGAIARKHMVEWNKADGMFQLALPERSMEFTGERMTTAIEGEIEFEHFHRYCLARDLCPGLDVLDVASGEGYGSSILATVAQSVTGVDVDPVTIAHAGRTYPGRTYASFRAARSICRSATPQLTRSYRSKRWSMFANTLGSWRKSSACCVPAESLSSARPNALFILPAASR